ncbi:MAG: hypothetical protein ACYCS1_05105 [Gammaproteobacteria bacterium]
MVENKIKSKTNQQKRKQDAAELAEILYRCLTYSIANEETKKRTIATFLELMWCLGYDAKRQKK